MRATLTELFPGCLFKMHKHSKDTYVIDGFCGRRVGIGKAYASTISKKHGLKTSAFAANRRVTVVGLEPCRHFSEKVRGSAMFAAVAKLGGAA